jgi:hypothetical protein
MALERLEKSHLPLLKSEEHVTLPELDAVGRRNLVDVLGIETKRVESAQKIMRGIVRRERGKAQRKEEKDAEEYAHHTASVVTFGMAGQGVKNRARPEG